VTACVAIDSCGSQSGDAPFCWLESCCASPRARHRAWRRRRSTPVLRATEPHLEGLKPPGSCEDPPDKAG
jgi:hypothetical protein